MTPDQVTFGSFFTNIAHIFGGGSGTLSSIDQFFTHVWTAVVVVGYFFSFVGLGLIVYILMRLFDLRAREKEMYETLISSPYSTQSSSSRFDRIRTLAAGESQSEWREAIIEADIMLDEALSRQGFTGVGVGEKLRQVSRTQMASVSEAWEAHKVRNQIAHEGSAFDLSQMLVSRTLARYEVALRELGAI